MSFSGRETDNGYLPLSIAASGGIGVFGGGQLVTINGAEMTAHENVLITGNTLVLGTQTSLSSTPKAIQARLSSQGGQVLLNADDSIVSWGGLVDGAAGVTIAATNLELNSISIDGQLSKSRLTSGGGSIDVQSPGTVKLHASDIVAAHNVSLNAGSLTLEHDTAGQGSTLLALDGAVTVAVTGDLINRGSLIQGAVRDTGDLSSLGAVTLIAGSNFLNDSPNENQLGAVFGQSDDVVIRAQGSITNRAARIVSNKNLIIEAQDDVSNVVEKSAGANGEQRTDYQTNHRDLLFFTSSRRGFDVDYGTLSMPGQLAYLVSDGDIAIKGKNIINRGGEINANNGSIQFAARDKFTNEGVSSGQVNFERKCLIVCKTHADSNVTVTGGLISAAQDVSIIAGTEAANIGGRVLALNDLTITAPRVVAQGITGYTTITRDRGMKAWFGDTWAQVYAADVGGSFGTSRGKLTINGTLYEDGGSANGAAGTEVTGGTVVVRPVQRDPGDDL